MNSRVAAALLSVAAVIAVALMLAAPGGLRWQAHPGTACDDLIGLQRALDLNSLGDQAVIRARTVQLAAALSEGARQGAQSGAGAVHDKVLTRLLKVIADQQATAQDLADALAPLAKQCGVALAS